MRPFNPNENTPTIGLRNANEYANDAPAPVLRDARVNGRLEGLLLDLHLRQTYRNESKRDIEAVYTFPVAWGARLLDLEVTLAGKTLRGSVTAREQARLDYEKSVEDGDTPVLVEQTGDGLYTANLGNLRPGDEAVLELHVAQLLRFEHGRLRIAVPTVIAPRYGDAHAAGKLAAHETAAVDIAANYPLALEIEIAGEVACADIASPSHKIIVTGGVAEKSVAGSVAGSKRVTLAPGATLDRDFILVLENFAEAAHSFCVAAGDTVLASFCPSVPRAKTPLSLKILVDCSGSMEGDSIAAARHALLAVLNELEDADFVSFSRFGSTVKHTCRQLLSCASAENRRLLANAIHATTSDLGGTEMRGAIVSTINNIAKPKVAAGSAAGSELPPASLLLITDGEVWDDGSLRDAVRKSGTRIFAVGIGCAPAEGLLRELARDTGGACEFVAPNEDAAGSIVRMFRRMRGTAATGVNVAWAAKPSWQSAPPAAIYDNETVHVFAQFAAGKNVAGSVTGALATPPVLAYHCAGKAFSISAGTAGTAGDAGDADTAAVLARLAGAVQMDEAKTDKEKTTLAVKHQLVSPYTSLFLAHVRDSADKADGLPRLAQVPQMLAAGWGGTGSVLRKAPLMYLCEAPHMDFCIQTDVLCAAPPLMDFDIQTNLCAARFCEIALHQTDFSTAIAELVTDNMWADMIQIIASIAAQLGVNEEDVWAVFLDGISNDSTSGVTLNHHARRLVNARLKQIADDVRARIAGVL